MPSYSSISFHLHFSGQNSTGIGPIRNRVRHHHRHRRGPGGYSGQRLTSTRPIAVDFINKLPVELISEIFFICICTLNEQECAKLVKWRIPPHHYRPILGPNTIPDILSSVCKGWRIIGLSTPKLWSAFTIPHILRHFETSDSEYEGNLMNTLRKWLKRSKDYPLQFNCLFLDNKRKITTTLFNQIHRWNVAYFKGIRPLDAFRRRLRINLLKAEMLDTLEFHRCDRLWDISFLHLPSLRRFAIDFDSLTVTDPGRLNLTHLILTDRLKGDARTFFEFLQQFPSLISFEASTDQLNDQSHHIPPTLFTHTTLTELNITGHGTPSRTILTNIHLPAIRRLRVNGIRLYSMSQTELNAVDVDHFIRRHESTFTDLEISGSSISSNEFIEILQMFQKYLVWCQYDLHDLTNENVRRLTLNPSDPSHDLALNLSYISLTVTTRWKYRMERCPSRDLLAEMILSRWKHNPRTIFDLKMHCPEGDPRLHREVARRRLHGSQLTFLDSIHS